MRLALAILALSALGCNILALVGLVVILSGCVESPTEPRTVASCESGCTETTPVPLDAAEVTMWMQKARDEVQAQADRGEIRLSVPLSQIPNPSIQWRPCPWTCSNCYAEPGGPTGRFCAAGSTSSDGRTIRVSTWQRDRRGDLVKWETRNSLYLRSGNGHLAYATDAPVEEW